MMPLWSLPADHTMKRCHSLPFFEWVAILLWALRLPPSFLASPSRAILSALLPSFALILQAQKETNNISIEQSTMKKIKAIIFNVIFQLVLAILIIDFQTNPQSLRLKCITAHAESASLGSGEIIDCIACQIFNSKQVTDQFIGYVSILVPLGDSPSGLNPRLPFDSITMNNNRLSSQFEYVADVYTQKGCSRYECPSLHLLDDFKFASRQHRELLNSHNIEHNNAIFKETKLSVTSVSYQLGIGDQQETIVLQSDFLNKEEVSSLMVRTRYSVVNRVEDDREPAILLYQLRTNILARFVLIMVVLLQSSKLYGLLSHFKTYLKTLLFAILVLGFYSSTTAVLASTLAIYLTIAKAYNAGKYGILSSLLFGLCSFLFMTGRVSFNIPAIVVTIYAIFILLRQLRDKCSLLSFGTLIGFVIAVISMWRLGWQFYIFITPLLILAGVLSLQDEREEKEVSRRQTNYNLVNFNDEEEDVLARIQRQLK